MDRLESLIQWAGEVARDPPRHKRIAIGAMIAGAIVLASSYPFAYNAFAGPFAVDAHELAAMKDVPFARYVTVRRESRDVEIGELGATGVYEERVSHGDATIVGTYAWLPVKSLRVLVHLAPGAGGASAPLTGVLQKAEYSHRLDMSRSAALMVDTDSGWLYWTLAAVALGALLLVGGLDQLRRAVRGPRLGGSFIPPRAA